ncbi:MAG: dihydropteroate synthase [Ignavibacteria bacterium]|nr:dihydropteroate synthase [Ignavibacteria bacterium]
MNVHISSVRNIDVLRKLIDVKKVNGKNFFFPTFGLSIKIGTDSKLIERFESLKFFFPVITEEMESDLRIIILGDLNSFYILAQELRSKEEFILAEEINNLLKNYKESYKHSYQIGKKIFSGDECYLMGVLNLTSDSFFDGGKYNRPETALRRIHEMIAVGVDIIDIGAESTRPGSEPVSAQDELSRILPVLKEIQKDEVTVSIDTYKSQVAEVCLNNGAHMINDISGLKFNPELGEIVARFNAGIILMHIKGTPKTMQVNPHYVNVIEEINFELKSSLELAKNKGISKIFIDPGIGFGKRLKDNYEILNRLDEFRFLGYPVAIGLSRKSFIGKVLNQTPPESLIGTTAANASAQLSGANIIRVHDVKEMNEVKKIINFIKSPDSLNG